MPATPMVGVALLIVVAWVALAAWAFTMIGGDDHE